MTAIVSNSSVVPPSRFKEASTLHSSTCSRIVTTPHGNIEPPAVVADIKGTTMEPDQLMACSWLQATSASKIIDHSGSGHKPVIPKNELHRCSLNFNQHPDKLCTDITNIMIRCAKKTIPRGKTKHIRVFWSKHLEELKRKRDALRNTSNQPGRTEDVKAWRRQSASVLRQAILQAKRTSTMASHLAS
ncbi:unnamed protein product [Rodentolepis nana]|uniref:TSL-kinase interacting protein 1-like n=1 Tax=Rodentolepis nana TaxID=102285 RepID=A0A0R3TFA0_RODNA|nr:unnamed protein product [Rodentolepis nana]